MNCHISNIYIYIYIYIYILYIVHNTDEYEYNLAFTLVVNRWKLRLCVGNSSVVKIYIIRPKPGPVAKNATPRPSGWESNRALWITRPVLYHWATEAVADNLQVQYIYINKTVMLVKYKGILIIFGIYTGFCSSVVEHWSSNPEDAGSIPSRKALELHFSQLVPVWVL